MINEIIFWLSYLVEKIGYPGVALSMFIESFFVPIPSELIMPFAGFIASQGKMNIYVLFLLGGLFSYLGSLPFYFLGYWGNEVVVNRFLKKFGKYIFISNEDIDKGLSIFNKYGNSIVLFGRVIPIIRSVISFPAGLAKMNFIQFSIYTFLGSTLWSIILTTLGYVLGSNWRVIGDYISSYEDIVIIVLGCILVGFITLRIINRKK